MHCNIFLAALAASTVSAAALASKNHGYPKEYTVTAFPDGLPEHLVPSNETSPAVLKERNNNAGVYFCTDRNFKGYCVHIVAPKGVCVGLGGDLNDKVTSVGPDQGNYCLFYADAGCPPPKSPHFGTWYPGYTDLSSSAGDPGRYWNDRISSYSC